MHTIVMAHEDAAHTAVEEQVLRPLDAKIFHVHNLELLPGMDIPRDVDALMVGTERVPDELLARLPNCRIVSRVGVGLDAIAVEEAGKRGIWVTNVPDFRLTRFRRTRWRCCSRTAALAGAD